MQLAVGSLNYITCKKISDDFNFEHKSVPVQNFRRAGRNIAQKLVRFPLWKEVKELSLRDSLRHVRS